MSFNAPQGTGGNVNNRPNNNQPSRPKGPLGLLVAGFVLVLVCIVWLAFFQNNLNVDSESFSYWAPYIPGLLGIILVFMALKKYKLNQPRK